MVKLEREPAPDFWTAERQEKWTARWQAKHGQQWKWPKHQNKRLNELIVEAMRPWHYHKCAFCEGKPEHLEIEHFAAKTRYPELAFAWSNLFLVCSVCNQAKGNQEQMGCIKPDEENPSDYLRVDPEQLQIVPQTNLAPAEMERSTRTIALYQLNRPELARKYIGEWWSRVPYSQSPSVVEMANGPSDLRWIGTYIQKHHAECAELADPAHPYSLMFKCVLERYAPKPESHED